MDLYRTIGAREIPARLPQLVSWRRWLRMRIENDLRGTSVGIEHIKEAFRSERRNRRASSFPAGTTGPNPTTSPKSTIRARWPPTYLASTGVSTKAYVITSLDGPAVSPPFLHRTCLRSGCISRWSTSYDVSSEIPVNCPWRSWSSFEDGFELRRRRRRVDSERTRYIGGTVKVFSGSVAFPAVGAGSVLGIRVRRRAKGRRGQLRDYALESGREAVMRVFVSWNI